MNVFHKVTLASLKENKTRTLVTIMGIILSAAMFSAVTTFAGSLLHNIRSETIYYEGAWHGRVQQAARQDYDAIRTDSKIRDAVCFQQLGYAPAEGVQSPEKPYFYLLAAEEDAQRLLPVHITSGRFPQTSGEILIPEHLRTEGRLPLEIGDTLSLDLGSRESEGYPLRQRNPYHQGEESLKSREHRSYQVVGFYERLSDTLEPYEAPGYTAFTRMDAQVPEDARYDVYFTMKRTSQLPEYLAELNHNTAEQNHQLLDILSQVIGDNLLGSFAPLVILLILFGSISLIYNAFAVSVSERTRQFGLLSSVGASPRQLGQMIRYEALVLSAIGIPLGLLAGVGGIAVTLRLLRSRFLHVLPVPMHLYISPLFLLLAGIVSLVTVLISAWVPAKRARTVTAVEAIRQNRDIQVGKSSRFRLPHKIRSLPAALADRYYRRSPGKHRATVASLFTSVVLFVCAVALSNYLTAKPVSRSPWKQADLDVSFWQEKLPEDPTDLLNQIRSLDSVTDAAWTQLHAVQAEMDITFLNPEILTDSRYTQSGNSVGFYQTLLFVDDDSFQELLREHDLDPQHFMDPAHPLGLALNPTYYFSPELGEDQYTDRFRASEFSLTAQYTRIPEGYNLVDKNQETGALIYEKIDGGKQLELPEQEALCQIQLNVGAVIQDIPYFASKDALIYPMSLADAIVSDRENGDYCNILSSDPDASEAALRQLLADHHFVSPSIWNKAAFRRTERDTAVILQTFAYGFVVLISLIAAINVFNTISTNVSLRRRDFAMLKSAGMGPKGLRSMLMYEGLLYCTQSLLLGLPVSGFLSWMIWKLVGMFEFHLPWAAMGIAAVGVFLVVFATMVYVVKQVRKETIIDTLRNENL